MGMLIWLTKLEMNTFMKTNNELVVFIISNGRPDNIITLETIKKAGCEFEVFIIIDNEDIYADRYVANYKNVIVFNKKEYADKVDNFDNTGSLRTTTHARNACFDIAEKLGYEYFLVLDDDYTRFKFRIDVNLNHPASCPNMKKSLNNVILKTLEYYKKTNFTSICFSQGGDWFGGNENFNKKPKRKAMNSFFCSTKRRFWFFSRLNEDVNTYMVLGTTGNIFLTIPFIQLDQLTTQKNKGGMSDAYLKSGTYVKSFYTVMCRPDCTVVNFMGSTNKRFHHLISWKFAVPLIIDEKHKKQ